MPPTAANSNFLTEHVKSTTLHNQRKSHTIRPPVIDNSVTLQSFPTLSPTEAAHVYLSNQSKSPTRNPNYATCIVEGSRKPLGQYGWGNVTLHWSFTFLIFHHILQILLGPSIYPPPMTNSITNNQSWLCCNKSRPVMSLVTCCLKFCCLVTTFTNPSRRPYIKVWRIWREVVSRDWDVITRWKVDIHIHQL